MTEERKVVPHPNPEAVDKAILEEKIKKSYLATMDMLDEDQGIEKPSSGPRKALLDEANIETAPNVPKALREASVDSEGVSQTLSDIVSGLEILLENIEDLQKSVDARFQELSDRLDAILSEEDY